MDSKYQVEVIVTDVGNTVDLPMTILNTVSNSLKAIPGITNVVITEMIMEVTEDPVVN